MTRKKRTQKGGALLLAISVVAGLVALTAAFSATQLSEFRARQNVADQKRAELMAEAGLERALAELSIPLENPDYISPFDGWAQLGQYGSDRFLVGTGWFRLEIVDAGAFVNLNTAPEEQLLRLPLTPAQVDSLLDWRSPDEFGRPEGAKDPYYNALDNPYNAALRRLETLDELFLVKEFTPSALYRPQTDTVNTLFLTPGGPEEQPILAELITVRSGTPDLAPGGQTKLNINTATVAQMVQRDIPEQLATAIVQRRNQGGTFTALGEVMLVPGMNLNAAATILDNFRIGNAASLEGRINLNTAPEPVLNTIPGFSQDISAGVLARQTSGFVSLGEITQVPGVTLDVLRQCADWITVGSDTFLVRVIGAHGRARSILEATVVLENGLPRVVHRWRPPVADPRGLWRWEAETTNDIDLGARQ